MSVVPAADRIYHELRRRIIFTELRPGEEIDVNETASEFGTSRTPVRDALHRLDHDGLVDVRPRALCRVAPVTLKTLVDVLDVREATGPMATRLADQDGHQVVGRKRSGRCRRRGIAAPRGKVVLAHQKVRSGTVMTSPGDTV